MTIYTDQPSNPNFLSPLNFKFNILKLPIFSRFVTRVSFPSIHLGSVQVPTPFRAIQVPGNPTDYGKLQVRYKLDEDMIGYISLFQWMHGVGITENLSEYSTLVKQNSTSNGLYSDATLAVLNSSKNPNVNFVLTNLFPVELGPWEMISSDEDVNYVESSVTFNFQSINIKSSN